MASTQNTKSNNLDTLKELKVAKFMADRSTLFFTRYFFKNKTGKKFIVGEHHNAIATALDKVISGEIKKLIINIAPRYGKTELAVKNFIAKGLAINSSARFIHLSYSDDLALDNSEDVKELINHESFQELYNVKIKRGSDSKKKWYTTDGGGVYATSAAGQVTGFGAGQVDEEIEAGDEFLVDSKNIFSGALIIDDPIKPEDGDSELRRERINQRYDSTIKNRVNSRNTPIIIIMQRVHENDLCGYLIDKDPSEWTVLSFPCIKEDGTALWEHKHTVPELEKMREDNPVVFERQYQQDPKPLKGLLFPKSELQFYEPSDILTASFETSVNYVDVSDEGSDHTSSPLGRNVGSYVYIPEVIFDKENMDQTVPRVAEMMKRNGVNLSRVESNSMGAPYGRALRLLVPGAQIQLISNSVNKHTRILMQAPFIKKYCRFLKEEHQSDEYKKFMQQLCSYMKEVKLQAKDDAPDSLSGLADFIWKVFNHLYQ